MSNSKLFDTDTRKKKTQNDHRASHTQTFEELSYVNTIPPKGPESCLYYSNIFFFFWRRILSDTKQTCHRHLHSLHPSPGQTQLCVGPQHLSNGSWSQVQHDRHNPPQWPLSYSTWLEGSCYSFLPPYSMCLQWSEFKLGVKRHREELNASLLVWVSFYRSK